MADAKNPLSMWTSLLSLGQVLRRAEVDSDESVQDILDSTAGIIFLGTPHRGSVFGGYAEVVRRIASATFRVDSSKQILRALSGADSPELELGHEAFTRLWAARDFLVKTFQETKGMVGLNIGPLNDLVGAFVRLTIYLPSWKF